MPTTQQHELETLEAGRIIQLDELDHSQDDSDDLLEQIYLEREEKRQAAEDTETDRRESMRRAFEYLRCRLISLQGPLKS